MPALRELQQSFGRALRGETAALLPAIAPGGLPAPARIAIYANGVFERYVEALGQTFPITAATLGTVAFRAAVQCYVGIKRQWHGDIASFGPDFPQFLAESTDERCPPWLADLAALEVMVRRLSEASPLVPADPAALAALTPEQQRSLRFLPAAGLGWLESGHDVLALWEAGRAGIPLAHLEVQASPTAILVTVAEEIELRPIPLAHAAWLAALAAGLPLEQALAAATVHDPGFDLTTGLAGPLARGELVPVLHPAVGLKADLPECLPT